MKKYLNPKLEILEFSSVDILTTSDDLGDLIERPNVTNPNEIPGVPLI